MVHGRRLPPGPRRGRRPLFGRQEQGLAGDNGITQRQINRELAVNLNRELTGIDSESADPDLSVEAGLGNSWVLGESAMWKVGMLGVADYKNTWRNKTRINRSQQQPDIDTGTTEISTNQVALTGSASAGVSYGEDHSLGFTYIFLRNTEDEASITERNNINFRRDQGAQLRDYRVRYEERELNLLQLTGRHTLGPDTLGDTTAGFLDGLEVTWYYSDAKATTDLPSEITVSAVDAVVPVTGDLLHTSVRSTTSAAEYRYTDLEDDVDSYGYKLNLPFEWASGRVTGGVFGGYDYYQKGRSYLQTQFNLGTTASAAAPVLVGTPEDVLTDANILDPANGFLLSLGGIGTESYLAGETIDAAFGGVDLTLDERWRLNAGVRWEDWSQLSVPVNQYEFRTSVGKVPLTAEQLATADPSEAAGYRRRAVAAVHLRVGNRHQVERHVVEHAHPVVVAENAETNIGAGHHLRHVDRGERVVQLEGFAGREHGAPRHEQPRADVAAGDPDRSVHPRLSSISNSFAFSSPSSGPALSATARSGAPSESRSSQASWRAPPSSSGCPRRNRRNQRGRRCEARRVEGDAPREDGDQGLGAQVQTLGVQGEVDAARIPEAGLGGHVALVGREDEDANVHTGAVLR